MEGDTSDCRERKEATPGPGALRKVGHRARPCPQRANQLERPGKTKHEIVKEQRKADPSAKGCELTALSNQGGE